MKKIILVCFTCLFIANANAQILRAEELENYAKEKYGDKWVDAAANLGSQLALDKNNSLTYTQVIECGEKTKERLYITLNYWFTATFNDAKAVIQLNDKDSGTIIAKGYVDGIAEHTGGMNRYFVSIHPIIKADIKDKKIRVTYTIQNYDITKMAGGGIMGQVSAAMGDGRVVATRIDEKWTLDTCFPFTEKDKHKKTSCKALIMAHAYSNVVMDKIEECVKNGLTGNEDDNW
jgi:hypothetical protein